MDYQAEIKAARTRLRMTQQDMTDFLGLKKKEQYRCKENGKTRFTDAEKAAMTKLFHWDYATMNAVLYEGQLPNFFTQEFPNGNFEVQNGT